MKTSPWKPGITEKIFITLLLAIAPPSAGVQAAGSETNRTDGINDAQVSGTALKRDPFWPVGYQPKRIVTQDAAQPGAVMKNALVSDWDTAMQSIEIQGVSSRADDEFYAVINGEVKSEGDTVSVDLGGTVYTWEIQRISPPGSVKLRRVSTRQQGFLTNEGR